MIVLLSCSTSWSKNEHNQILSTGEPTHSSDSVLVSYEDLRKANAKMVELKYQKEINDSLRSIIANDDIIRREYDNNINVLKKQIKQESRKFKTAVWGGAIISFFLAAALMIK